MESKENSTGKRRLTRRVRFSSEGGVILGKLEKIICYASIALLALLPVLDAFLKRFAITISPRTLMTQLFLVLGFFAAMLTTLSKEHISITITQFIKNEKIKNTLSFLCKLTVILISSILAWNSVSFIKYALSGSYIISFSFFGSVIGLTDRFFACAMPLCFGVMALRFALQIEGKAGKAMGFAAILAGTVLALPAVAKIFWGFVPPEPFYSWVNSLYDLAWIAKTPVILLLILMALSGTPIFAVIGGIAMIMLQSTGGEPDAAPIQIYSAFTSMDIIAIPLFTLTGFFLSESKAGERLVHAFKSFFSWLPGGMLIATVVICAFFTSFTGASGVTILALGGILFTILAEKSKYPEQFSVGILTSVGGIGLLFPPSLPIILVGATTLTTLHFMEIPSDYSIIDFFLGALIPGVLLVFAMIIFGIISSIKTKIPVERFELSKAVSALKGSALEILLPIILVAGYFSGFLSLVEVSAVSVIYAFAAEVLINKDIKLSEVSRVFAKSAPIIGGVLAILAMAKALSYAIIDSQVPESLAIWMQNTIQSKFAFLLLLNVALLVVGCLMDIFSAILVVLPLIIPLSQVYGIDPIHLGIIFVINLEVGFLTPPVGLNLFLASYRFKRPFIQICRYVLPFLLIQLVVVLLVTYIPALSTMLPGLF